MCNTLTPQGRVVLAMFPFAPAAGQHDVAQEGGTLVYLPFL